MSKFNHLSKLESYLSIYHSGVEQLPSEEHDEVIGFYKRKNSFYIIYLKFPFGKVEVASHSVGELFFEVLVLVLNDLDIIMDSARKDMLNSGDISSEDYESILANTFPGDISLYPLDRKCRIGIRNDIGYWKKRAADLHEYGEISCAEEFGRMVYKKWYFIT